MSSIPQKMLIARNERFGAPELVHLQEAPVPIPGPEEILVKVHATAVTAADWRLRSKSIPRGFGLIMSLLFGFTRPRYQALGTCLAGQVVAKGKSVSRFNIGDRIVANLGMKLGGHAQYSALSQNSPIARIADSISYETAAAMVFGGSTALVFLRDKLAVKAGDRLLVIGAGGSVGSAAIQIGKSMGAHVTGVCSTDKVNLVKSLGADAVIDYKIVDWRLQSQTYDVILDTVGGTNFSNTRHKLTPHGKLGLVVADLPLNLMSLWISATNKQKMIAGPIAETSKDLEALLDLITSRKFTPYIGARFEFKDIVKAHQLVDQGHKAGNTIIQVP